MIKPEKLEVTTTLKTLDYIEVPASTKKDHKLTFFSYKEGMYTAKVKSPTCVCDPGSFSGFFLTRSSSLLVLLNLWHNLIQKLKYNFLVTIIWSLLFTRICIS